ncbi:hypothetical protein Q4566_06975 [Tamlana sp. 2_MG-2023]|uniref:hypothetical protein n=1 Tax=unclassified Tamlana TaxID=2614803 RepID=UPI0026E30943|nr:MULTISPECIES: hypothetical protein [unclassified Tamlana]MDO6759939.1 hypothetical protein [Tamlana sp. 2_MG-2023]MDO6791891.1 hypothetical protein [Tamlana sp. 1_MG-2023]
MSRHFVSIILSMIFLAFIAAPTVIKMVDNTIDISFFYSFAEEEENGSTKNLNKEIVVLEDLNSESSFFVIFKENNMGYVSKNYTIPHLNLVSPPPDFYIV